uniref:Uncharacterized protein n=1 Tax=viral metagenome TaxID=1070528 RepID=A0A6H1ZKP8_9ZZZZ
MKYMCLACGHFFESETKCVCGESKCPECRDTFFCDNIIPEIPPDIPDLEAWQIERLEELGL